MKDSERYTRQLEESIRRFLEPIKGIPLAVVIKALTGCEVLSFDPGVMENRKLIEDLSHAAGLAGQNAFQEGIVASRPNEAGNRIEPFVLEALGRVGLKADRPSTRTGKRRAAGYPDIEIVSRDGVIAYLDCKTYSTATKDQSFRTFYFSPSDDPKITKDGFHLLMSFELDVQERKGRKVFVPVSWQIYSLDKLLIQVKHEFNASNRELYRREALLAEGKIGA
jgi:hypothetical protein